METKEKPEEFIQGFALTGDIISGLKNKEFTIISAPRYVEREDFKDATKTVKKMVLDVKLFDGVETEYFPNKTAQTTILNERGYRLANWVGYKGKFVVREIQIGKEMKKAVYLE